MQTAGRVTGRLWPALSVALLAACSGGPDNAEPSGVERRDSAGVGIVENSRPAWGNSSRWHIDPAPLLDLASSGAGNQHVFDQVRGVVRLSDGSIAVANGGSHELRFYSPDGNFRAALGREGEGPGEFLNMRGVSLTASDTLLVLDYGGRMTVLGPNGVLARVVRLPGYAVSVHALGDSEVVVVFGYASVVEHQGSRGMIRRPNALWRYDIGGTRLDSIGRTAGYEEYMFAVEGGPSGAATPIFGRSAHVATHGDAIFRGNGTAMQIEELSPSGQLLRIFRLVDYPLELTREVVLAERAARLGVDPHPLVRQIVDQLPDPESRPAYAQVLVDAEAAVWLRPYLGRSEQGGPESWLVLDSTGTWLGRVDVMEGLRVMSVESDVLLGVWTDSLGVERPRVHRLRRGR